MIEEKTIEINVNLNKSDIWRFYYSHFFSFNSLFYYFFYLVFFGLTLLFLFLGDDFLLDKFFELFGLALLFSLLFALLLTYISANNNGKADRLPAKYIISNEKIEVITEEFTSEIKWNYFNKTKETRNHFFLNMNDGQKLMFPKREFTNNEQLLKFKDLLRAKLENEAYLKKPKENLGLK